MSAAVAAKLAEARKLIERGWCQGYVARAANGDPVDHEEFLAGGPVAAYCAQGAIIQACGSVDRHWAAVDLLGEALGGRDYEIVGDWNDDEVRTQAEVIEAFRKAEQLARESA